MNQFEPLLRAGMELGIPKNVRQDVDYLDTEFVWQFGVLIDVWELSPETLLPPRKEVVNRQMPLQSSQNVSILVGFVLGAKARMEPPPAGECPTDQGFTG